MHTQRVAVAIAAAAGMISTFLPWINAPFAGGIDGASMEDGLGWITFTLCAIALLCAFSGSRDNAFPPGGRVVCALTGILVCLIALGAVSHITELTGGKLRVGRYGVGAGLFLLIIADATITLSPMLAARRPTNRPPSNPTPRP